MNDLPPMKSIRVFEACIRLRNFTRAARELNVGQPAISHQIHSLEQDLGIKLFERRGSIAIPTAEAMTYYRMIASSLADMARASVAIRKKARERGLTLATYPGISSGSDGAWRRPGMEGRDRRNDGKPASSRA